MLFTCVDVLHHFYPLRDSCEVIKDRKVVRPLLVVVVALAVDLRATGRADLSLGFCCAVQMSLPSYSEVRKDLVSFAL